MNRLHKNLPHSCRYTQFADCKHPRWMPRPQPVFWDI